MIKKHPTDPRCCGVACPKMLHSQYTYFCQYTVEILDYLRDQKHTKILRTPACLRRFGV